MFGVGIEPQGKEHGSELKVEAVQQGAGSVGDEYCGETAKPFHRSLKTVCEKTLMTNDTLFNTKTHMF